MRVSLFETLSFSSRKDLDGSLPDPARLPSMYRVRYLPSFFFQQVFYLPTPPRVYVLCTCPCWPRLGHIHMFSDIYTSRTYAQFSVYSVQWQKPIPSFPAGALAGHLPSCFRRGLFGGWG